MVVALQPASFSHSDASWAPAPKLKAQQTLARHSGSSVRTEDRAGMAASVLGRGPPLRLLPGRRWCHLVAAQPVLDERGHVGAAQHLRVVGGQLRLDLLVQLVHPRPVSLW